jgi:hypothetical protein
MESLNIVLDLGSEELTYTHLQYDRWNRLFQKVLLSLGQMLVWSLSVLKIFSRACPLKMTNLMNGHFKQIFKSSLWDNPLQTPLNY